MHHNADAVDGAKIQCVDLGDLPLEIATTTQGCLRWEKAATIVFVGNVSSEVATTLAVCLQPSVAAFPVPNLAVQIERAVLTLREGNWIVEVPIDLSAARDGPAYTPRWLISTDPVQFAPPRCGAADVTCAISFFYTPAVILTVISVYLTVPIVWMCLSYIKSPRTSTKNIRS